MGGRGPGTILNVTTMLPIGDFVLVEGVARGSLTRALGLVPAAGRPFAVRRGFIIRLHNSRISSVAAFMNGKELAGAVRQLADQVAC